jgi:hypothetical protein
MDLPAFHGPTVTVENANGSGRPPATRAATSSTTTSSRARARAHARVDGHNAYGSEVAVTNVEPSSYRRGSVLAGVPALSVEEAGDPGADLTIDEAEDFVHCRDGDPYPVKASECGAWAPTGVRLARRITQTRNGTLVFFTDVFTSVDVGNKSKAKRLNFRIVRR